MHSNIKPSFIEKSSKCDGCSHNNNVGCRLLAGKFLNPETGIPRPDERILAIKNLQENNRISSSEFRECQALETATPLAGIQMAFRLIDSRDSRNPVRMAAMSGQMPKTLASRQQCGSEEVLAGIYREMNIVMNGASNLKLENDDCDNEGREIKSMFAGVGLDVQIDLKREAKVLDIEIDNPGSGMIIDGLQNGSNDDFIQGLARTELLVCVDQPIEMKERIIMDDIGSNEGLIVD